MKKVTTTLVFLLLVSSFTLAQAIKKDVAVKKVAVVKANKTKIVNNGVQNTNTTTYDFTTGSGQFYGGASGATQVESGVWGMIAGDADQNGGIGASDLTSTRAELGALNYNNNDVDMNSGVGSSDLVLIRNNLGKITQLP